MSKSPIKKIRKIVNTRTTLNLTDSSFEKIINKGTGAGGANTNFNGLSFENKTSIETTLLNNQFIKIIMNPKNKYGYYYEYKDVINKKYRKIYLTQSGFKIFFKKEFNIDIYTKPDEAFLIFEDTKCHIKILEKKNQNVDGSIEDKLKTGLFNKREYEKMLNKNNKTNFIFTISYAFCISKFLKNKFESNIPKYNNIKEIMIEDNINLFYGCDNNYFDKLFEWINN